MAETKMSLCIYLDDKGGIALDSLEGKPGCWIRLKSWPNQINLYGDIEGFERLAEACNAVIRMKRIEAGLDMLDDGDGLTPGGKPVKTAG